jgi:hypothetical protein
MPESVALAAPPRSVPLSLWVRTVFGGVMVLIGWIVLGIGGVFAAVFLRMAEPLFDPLDTARRVIEGRVTAVEQTSVQVNKVDVQAVRFEFPVGERQVQGISYTTGGAPAVGSSVPVEYAPGHPGSARVRGMRSAPFPSAVRTVLVMPAAGAVVLLLGMMLGLRTLRLLRHGVLARAQLVASEPTNTKINNQRVHRLTFRWRDAAGRDREGTYRTHRLAPVTDEREELLLHEPDGPRVMPWDALPFTPPRDAEGHFLPLGFGQLARVLIAPSALVVLWSLGSPLLDVLPS